MAKLRVGVLFGGRSAEHEVSLVSAASVLRGLDSKKFEVIPIGITKAGRWVLPRQLASGEPTHTELRRALTNGRAVSLPAEPGAGAVARPEAESRAPLQFDVLFPVLHGTFGEDGTVQGLLELADIPYVGAGVLGSALGMDKEVQKRLFLQAKLPVAKFASVLRREWEAARARALQRARSIRLPVFVKPANLGSSVGITKVKRAGELEAAIEHAFEFDRKVLVEQGIAGREIEVSVLGNDEPRASLPGEVIPAREFYDYTAKYLEDSTRFLVPAKLKPAQVRRFQELAVEAFRALDCAGMARVDFLLERRSGRIYLNEVNTIPGFTAISMYPKLWEASGLPYGKLLEWLIELALERHREKLRTRFSIELPQKRGGVLKE